MFTWGQCMSFTVHKQRKLYSTIKYCKENGRFISIQNFFLLFDENIYEKCVRFKLSTTQNRRHGGPITDKSFRLNIGWC
jgi:hypothetical protein